MPAFVIHRLGAPPRKVVADGAVARVGREATNEIQLEDDAVSRQHAVFSAEPHGGWKVECVSATNPIVVNGALISGSAPVAEGTEVVIGGQSMIIFSATTHTANAYMGSEKYFDRSTCASCGWSGMVSSVRKDPVCPSCATKIEIGAARRPDNEAAPRKPGAAEKATNMLGDAEMKGVLDRLKSAQQSRLERVDGKDPTRTAITLTMDKAITIGKAKGSAMSLQGLITLGQLNVKWDGKRYVVTSAMTFPSMRINGHKIDTAPLVDGDEIEVGSNRFRFSVGKPAG